LGGRGVAFSSPESFFGNLTKLRTAGRSQEEEEEEEEVVEEEGRRVPLMSDCLLKMKKLCADPRTNVQMIDIDVGHGSDIGMGFSGKMLTNVRPALQNPREMEGFYKVGASEDSEERERERERERESGNKWASGRGSFSERSD